jgi:hypothetical protein
MFKNSLENDNNFFLIDQKKRKNIIFNYNILYCTVFIPIIAILKEKNY